MTLDSIPSPPPLTHTYTHIHPSPHSLTLTHTLTHTLLTLTLTLTLISKALASLGHDSRVGGFWAHNIMIYLLATLPEWVVAARRQGTAPGHPRPCAAQERAREQGEVDGGVLYGWVYMCMCHCISSNECGQ